MGVVPCTRISDGFDAHLADGCNPRRARRNLNHVASTAPDLAGDRRLLATISASIIVTAERKHVAGAPAADRFGIDRNTSIEVREATSADRDHAVNIASPAIPVVAGEGSDGTIAAAVDAIRIERATRHVKRNDHRTSDRCGRGALVGGKGGVGADARKHGDKRGDKRGDERGDKRCQDSIFHGILSLWRGERVRGTADRRRPLPRVRGRSLSTNAGIAHFPTERYTSRPHAGVAELADAADSKSAAL